MICGRFGSGKTEIALNYATTVLQDKSPYLIDLDVVTPYFRSRDLSDVAQQGGVTLVSPVPAATTLDIPGITPEITGALQQEQYPVVVDVGGDWQGARILGQYAPILAQRTHALLFVVNPYRPFTNDAQVVEQSVEAIQKAARLSIIGLISNPHVLDETTSAQVEDGHRAVVTIANEIQLPVRFLAVDQKLVDVLPEAIQAPILPLTRFLRAPWQAIPSSGR